ncbi:ABC transporter ATP-binding protein [Bacteroidota bacterium]
MIVELEKISKSYEIPGSNHRRIVLNDISLSIDSGDSVSIVGPSGSGKSTFLNIIGTLDKPDSGSVKFDKENISEFHNTKLAELRNNNIGFVFQLHHLLPQLNMMENILLPLIPQKNKKKQKEAAQRAIVLLENVGLADNIFQRPGQLSGGECQRAAVVRALINEPELILADEPTGSLDQESAQQMGELLSKINKEHNITLVVVTHSMELAGKMNNMYSLSNGKLDLIKT